MPQTDMPVPNADPPAVFSAAPPRRVLIVDDSRLQRRIVAAFLNRWGYVVSEAASGEEALTLCAAERVDIVISDWMMPGMSGPEFCRAFRALPRAGYGYFILLTGRSEKAEVARGLDMGADDFLAKPVDPAELRARIAAGERILRMEETLQHRNRALQLALGELRGLYDLIERDLVEARKLQQSLVRERFRNFGTAEVALFLAPCGHVGGDLVGVFSIGADRIGFFSLDVSGHGVSSALMTARLAGMLSGEAQPQGVAFLPLSASSARRPEEVAARLNRLLLDEIETDHYATLVYGEADLLTGRVRLVQAGHPHPAILRASGEVEFVGQGGLPVGLVEGASYEAFDLRLLPGDRLLVLSDGVTECAGADGCELGEDGLAHILRQNRMLAAEDYLDGLLDDMVRHADGRDFTDDMSGVMLHFRGDR